MSSELRFSSLHFTSAVLASFAVNCVGSDWPMEGGLQSVAGAWRRSFFCSQSLEDADHCRFWISMVCDTINSSLALMSRRIFQVDSILLKDVFCVLMQQY